MVFGPVAKFLVSFSSWYRVSIVVFSIYLRD